MVDWLAWVGGGQSRGGSRKAVRLRHAEGSRPSTAGAALCDALPGCVAAASLLGSDCGLQPTAPAAAGPARTGFDMTWVIWRSMSGSVSMRPSCRKQGGGGGGGLLQARQRLSMAGLGWTGRRQQRRPKPAAEPLVQRSAPGCVSKTDGDVGGRHTMRPPAGPIWLLLARTQSRLARLVLLRDSRSMLRGPTSGLDSIICRTAGLACIIVRSSSGLRSSACGQGAGAGSGVKGREVDRQGCGGPTRQGVQAMRRCSSRRLAACPRPPPAARNPTCVIGDCSICCIMSAWLPAPAPPRPSPPMAEARGSTPGGAAPRPSAAVPGDRLSLADELDAPAGLQGKNDIDGSKKRH